MKFKHIKEGILNYIHEEVVSKADGPMKFIMYTGIALAVPKLDLMYEQYKNHPLITALELIKDDEIDIEALYTAMKEAMNKVDKVEYMGIIFNEQDVDMVYNHIMKQSYNNI